MDHAEIVRLYGPWLPRVPADAVTLFDGYRGDWWVAGGWAIEAFTGVERPHGDLDVGIPRREVPLLREHVAGRLDVWEARSGTLAPLIDGVADPAPEAAGLWLRPSGAEPWEYDVLLTDVDEDSWVYRRDRRVTRSRGELVWRRDGVPYLSPEVQLLYKAAGLRAQDRRDFDSTLPLLAPGARAWVRDALAVAHPGHPWLAVV